ncbi:MAG: hypothetical protein ACTSSG_00230 [Candidatus Heimdallarchaeaceae archaeon]
MSKDEDVTLKKKRILRFIRDLDLRYIRGSIDRRTYQTLKNKYQEILDSFPAPLSTQKPVKPIEISKETERILEGSFEKPPTSEPSTIKVPPPQRVIEIPSIELENVPPVEIEELKIRYVMNMAIKAATKSFEEEMAVEQEYVANKIDDQEYLSKKNEIEAKQHKIFQHFYKLSELLFSVSKDHLYKNTHNNFLLFNNELSENINRLRRMETDKKELKGIIYDINERVLRHRPILKKAAQDTLDWKLAIQQQKEKFLHFKSMNQYNLTEKQKIELDRKIRQLQIYEELLDDDINDYAKDLDAMDEIYGEHLRFQEIITPYFKELSFEIEERIQNYSEVISSLQFRKKIGISQHYFPKELDYQLIAELKSLWRFSGRPVIDEQNDLVGLLVGPGQFGDQYGIIVRQQQEISLSMIRRIYDYIVAPDEQKDISEEDKKLYLLNEIIKKFPQLPLAFLIPQNIIKYSQSINRPLSEELVNVMTQPERFLFIPIEFVTKSSRNLLIKSEKIVQNGEILPYFNPNEANMIFELIQSKENTDIIDLYGKILGKALTVVYHPNKGYFLVMKRDNPCLEFFEKIYEILYNDKKLTFPSAKTLSLLDKKEVVVKKLCEEYQLPQEEIESPTFLKKVLIEKNTGILPNEVENSKFQLISLGNVRVISDVLQINFGSPVFQISDIFELEGKVVENVKGTEIGVVFNLELSNKPLIYLWTSIDLLLIASFIDKQPEKLFDKDENFVDNLAISIGKQLSIAPQVALRPDIVLTFLNLIGKINTLEKMEETISNFKPKSIELQRIISIDKRKILADISDKEIMDEIRSDIEVGQIDEDNRFVTSPDYYLRRT